MCSAGAPDEEDGAGEGEAVGRQLALLEARGGGARLDAACSAAERLLALLADAGPSGGPGCKEQAQGLALPCYRGLGQQRPPIRAC